MTSRRHFLAQLSSSVMLPSTLSASFCAEEEAAMSWFMPEENAPHRRTWMAFGAHRRIWGRELLPIVQRNLAGIANAIVKFEPVSMLVRPNDRALAEKLCSPNIQLVTAELDDLWVRDTGPVFVWHPQLGAGGIDLNFNGWGKKQAHRNDAGVAKYILQHTKTRRIQSELTGEGGGIEVDGEGTGIATESCWLISNRNPGVRKRECEKEFLRIFGLRKIIWLPGVRGAEITDGHTDFYARFAKPGVVVASREDDRTLDDYDLTRKHLEILQTATDANGRRLKVEVLPAPRRIRPRYASDDFAAGYVNYYVCNKAVITTEFGDRQADASHKNTLQRLYPGRTIVPLNIDGIAAGGGGIHCATQQEPLPRER